MRSGTSWNHKIKIKSSNAVWLTDPTFWRTEKLNHLKWPLESKDKTIGDLIKKNKKTTACEKWKTAALSFSCNAIGKACSGSWFCMYRRVMTSCINLDRSLKTDWMSLSLVLHSLPIPSWRLMWVRVQMAELFSVRTVELEMEIINLQDDIQLKSKQHSQHLQSLGVWENYKNSHYPILKVSALFGFTYLCEAAFSDRNVIKSKFIRTECTLE